MIAIEKVQEQLEEIFARQGVTLAYLFGSQAEGRAGPLSDVDVAVLLGPDVPPRQGWSDPQITLMDELARLFGVKRVDVVILNRATPLLAHQVVKYGRVIYEDESRPAVDFAVYAISRYADSKPLRDLRHRYLAERIAERKRQRAGKPPSTYRW
jgi:predicted nucleotidyltransferase